MANKETDEKRVAIRFPYRGPVSYRVMGGAGAPPSEVAARGEILDLSNAGIRMRTEGRVLEEGAVVQTWVPVSEPPVTIPVLTQVRWVRQENAGAYLVGLRFML